MWNFLVTRPLNPLLCGCQVIWSSQELSSIGILESDRQIVGAPIQFSTCRSYQNGFYINQIEILWYWYAWISKDNVSGVAKGVKQTVFFLFLYMKLARAARDRVGQRWDTRDPPLGYHKTLVFTGLLKLWFVEQLFKLKKNEVLNITRTCCRGPGKIMVKSYYRFKFGMRAKTFFLRTLPSKNGHSTTVLVVLARVPLLLNISYEKKKEKKKEKERKRTELQRSV